MKWIDDAEIKIIAGLIKMANQGSVNAANTALKLLAEKREATAASEHRNRIEELKEDPIKLAYYLGEIGADNKMLKRWIGARPPTSVLTSWEQGKRDRSIEIQAIELTRVRQGTGRINEWMRLDA